MRISSIAMVGLSMLIAEIFLSYLLVQEEDDDTIVMDQPIFAQLGIPSDSILLNKTNMTAQIAPTIIRNTTITPAPEVNDTLIGRSTPTTSNTTLPVDNKTGEAKPLGGIKWGFLIFPVIMIAWNNDNNYRNWLVDTFLYLGLEILIGEKILESDVQYPFPFYTYDSNI